MEVTCDRCQAEYEFEEALISPGGTTVKCTGCGHLFKVHRAAQPQEIDYPPITTESGQNSWIVELEGGQKRAYPTLKDVTEQIRSGELTKDDRISRTGRAFRRLGDIEELSRFFSQPPSPASGAAARRGSTNSMRPGASVPPPIPTDRTRTISSADRPPVQLTMEEVLPAERSHPVAPAPRSQRPRLTTPMPRPLVSTSPPQRNSQLSESLASNPVWPSTDEYTLPSPLPPPPEPDSDSIHDDPTDPEIPLSQHSSESAGLHNGVKWSMAIALVMAIGLVSGLLIWTSPSLTPSPAPPPTAETEVEKAPHADVSAAVERGDRLLDSYDLRKFPQAIVAYEIALAQVPNDPHLLSSLSRVHAQWSQALLFTLADRDVRRQISAPALDPAAITTEQQNHAEAAKELAVRAARKNPGNEEAEIALADALRLSGNLVGARLELDRVRASQAQPDAETLRVASLLAIAEASGDLQAGRADAEAAVHRGDGCIACQVLLVRILAATGATSEARNALAVLTLKAPNLQEVERLRRLLQRAPEASTSNEDSPASVAPPTPQASASADALCERGEQLLEEGATSRAKAQFDEALKIIPDYARADTGLGYIALERGAPRTAINLFRQAANHGSADAFLGLGEAYRDVERPNAAIRAYRAYLARYGGQRGASIARQQLEVLLEAQAQAEATP